MSGYGYLFVLLFGVACFVVGFFVGKKNGQRAAELATRLKDTLGKA
jgi:hypothetical protein